MPQLTQDEIDALDADCSGAFTPDSPEEGCYYGLTEGLPCGATAIILEILSNGDDGTALGAVTICCGSGTYVRLDYQITTAGADGDCTANHDTGGAGCNSIGYAASGGCDCDFLMSLLDPTLVDIEAQS